MGACPNAQTPLLEGDLDRLLSREWLLTNGLGGYSSSSVLNCHTRRYHGLLVAATVPPVGRVVTLNNVLERLNVGGQEFELSNFEFNGAIHPRGYGYQTDFYQQIDPQVSNVCFVYQVDGVTFIRSLWLLGGHNVALMYWLAVDTNGSRPIRLEVQPLLSMRDFHSLRRRGAGPTYDARMIGSDLYLQDLVKGGGRHKLQLAPTGLRGPVETRFHAMPDWWYNFRYRMEAFRGQDCGEDLYTPGYYEIRGRGRVGMGLWVNADGLSKSQLDELLSTVNAHLQFAQSPLNLVDQVSSTLSARPDSSNNNPLHEPPELTLLHAAGQFIVKRRITEQKSSTSILAGYHWFGDWGRDTFISLPGLLLSTGRYEQAREVLFTFGQVQRDGLIPNRFDDYGGEPAYNSVDASLWYINAVDQYLQATGDQASWDQMLRDVCCRIVEAFINGTRFNVKMDDRDCLVSAGSEDTQITWMDARCGDTCFTPRWGKPVEINALWYNALGILIERLGNDDPKAAGKYSELSAKAAASFHQQFWCEQGRYLYDCVRDDFKDPAIRPNQIFAVSLKHSPLPKDMQKAVVDVVREHLLTPYGLRSLSPADPNYKGRYGGDQFQRDSAYHQGTVWAYLIGPFVEAFLKVNDNSEQAANEAQEMIKPLLDHLYDGGIGQISEIFEGDPPHAFRGCIAQAWSVAELIRALLLIRQIQPSLFPAMAELETS